MGMEGPSFGRKEESSHDSQQEKSSSSQKGNVEEGSYSQEYSDIINSSISPYNIQTFHDDVLRRLIKIVGRIVDEYKNNHPGTGLIGRDLEDEALKEEGLQDIPSVLDSISKRKIDLHNIEEIIKSRVGFLPEVLVPPGEGGIIPGPGESFQERGLIPRLTTLLYILENDLFLDLQDGKEIQIVEGIVTDDMMRKHPYFRVSISPLNRIVYVCEEEENATFVFDKEELDDLNIQVEELDITNKATFDKLIEKTPKIGVRIIQSKLWRTNILEALTNDLDQKEKKAPKQNSDFGSNEIIPKKKDGWESASSMDKDFRIADVETIKNYVELFRKEAPEWYERQRVSNGKAAEHYHPDLVKKIVSHFESAPKKKQGWESSNSLKEITNVGVKKIKKYIEQFRLENPDWFEVQKTAGNITEHYHPDLVKIIKEHFPPNEAPQKKHGWESSRSLRRNKVSNVEAIEKYVEQFKQENKEWFEKQRSHGNTAEYYHPDLVAKIIENFKK